MGKDGKFGGSRGAIDFLPGKSRPKKKAMGGMMKSKMASKGGARGGRRVMGGETYENGRNRLEEVP